MNQPNPYQPPAAEVASRSTNPPLTLVGWSLVTLVALQVALSALNLPSLLESVRVGEASVLNFLLVFLANLLLMTGGILVATKSRAATYVFGISAMFAIMAVLQWQALLYLSSAILASGACVVTFIQNRSRVDH